MLVQRRLFHVLRKATVAAPMERHRAAAMRDDKPQRRKVLEQIALDKLHESGGVAIDVMRAGVMEVRIARRRHMDHRRHIQFAQFLVDRIPVAVDQRRIRPHPARWVWIEIDPDEAELVDDTLQLWDAVLRRYARKLRQLA